MSLSKVNPGEIIPVRLVDAQGNDVSEDIRTIRKLLEKMNLQNDRIIELLQSPAPIL